MKEIRNSTVTHTNTESDLIEWEETRIYIVKQNQRKYLTFTNIISLDVFVSMKNSGENG